MTTPPQLNSIPELDASFGIIPLRKEAHTWSIFIIRHIKGGHWGFPKGHPSTFSESSPLRGQENYAGQAPSSPSEAHLLEDKKATMDKPNNKEETPCETAERELREETGLTVTNYLPIEPFSTRYLCISHGKYVDKTVTYFVAEVAGTVTLCPNEITDGIWVTPEEAAQKMQFPEMKAMVETLAACLTRNAF